MYVSFISAQDGENNQGDSADGGYQERKKEEEIAVLLISADKESFFELKEMRDEVVGQLEQNGSMAIIKRAVQDGRPSTTDIVPGTQVRHFLYKSRANVQFMMPSFTPHFMSIIARRK